MENKQLVFDQFVRNYKENDTAKSYYNSRGLSQKLVDDNLIGFCPIHSKYSFPLLRGRLVIPINNVYGETIAIAGRQIPEYKEKTISGFWESFGDEPAKCQDRINKWNKGKWINEPYQKTKNLFFLNHTKNEVMKKNYIVLVEGYFDAYGLYDNGVKNVAALCGTSISDYQVALASRYCDHIVLLMDSDDPGKNAANNITKKIEDLGGKSYKVFLPYGFDPDDFAKNYDLSFFDESINNMIAEEKKSLIIRV